MGIDNAQVSSGYKATDSTLDWIKQVVDKSFTGISIERFRDGNSTYYRVMWHHHLCEPAYTFEEAISIGIRDWVGMCNQFKKEV